VHYYGVNALRMCSAYAIRPHARWHKITVKMLNYDTIQLSALVELAEYQKRENKDIPVPNTVSVFPTHANIQ
jgi:protein-tyrosine phosphatase